jgi:hypothetical protein
VPERSSSYTWNRSISAQPSDTKAAPTRVLVLFIYAGIAGTYEVVRGAFPQRMAGINRNKKLEQSGLGYVLSNLGLQCSGASVKRKWHNQQEFSLLAEDDKDYDSGSFAILCCDFGVTLNAISHRQDSDRLFR